MERLWLAPTFAVVTLLVIGPLGAFFHVWPGLAGFQLMLLGLLVGVVFGIGLAAAAAYATVTDKSWRPRAVRAAFVPLTVGLLTLLAVSRNKAPMIHDISTDLTDRLEFTPDVAAASLNKDGTADERSFVDETQRAAYPDIAPIALALPPDQAFARAKSVAESMPSWNVTSADAAAGRIDATATSRIFHFVDDVVIRVRADGAGSHVDVRSRSRVGQSDLGANAARIRAFADALRKAS